MVLRESGEMKIMLTMLERDHTKYCEARIER
jgi:hypothetical protein